MPYSENTNPIYPDAANTDPIYHQPQYGSPDAQRLFEEQGSPRVIANSLEPHATSKIDPEFCVSIDPVLNCPVSAQIYTARFQNLREGHDSFLVLDVRERPRDANGNKKFGEGEKVLDPSVDYLLIGRNFDFQNGQGFKGIRRGETVRVGRDNPTIRARFGLNQTPAANAFTIAADKEGKMTLTDDASPRGTMLVRGTTVTHPEPFTGFGGGKYRFGGEDDSGQPHPQEDVLSPEDEELIAGLGAQTSAGLSELREKFGKEIDEHNVSLRSIVGVMSRIKALRAEGVPEKAIKRRVLFDLHPDRAGSPQQGGYNEVLFEAADHLLRGQ